MAFEPVVVGLAAAGGYLLWAAVTGRPPIGTLQGVLNGEPAPRPARELGGFSVFPSAATVAARSAEGPPSTPQTLTGALRVPAGGGGVVAGKDFGNGAGVGDQGNPLVYIGQGSHRLQPTAAQALAAASKVYGRTIKVTDSYRSAAQQIAAKRAKPTLAATPGKSLHEQGLALDVAEPRTPALVAALSQAGWQQFDPVKEPWHWSYGRKG